MPCTNKAVWDIISKPGGEHIAVCGEHKECTEQDLRRNGEVEVSKVDAAHAPDCAHLTDDDLRKLLL